MALPAHPLVMVTTAMQLSIVLIPVLAYGVIRRSKKVLVASGLTLAIGLVQSAVLFTPSFGLLSALHYNWMQKALVFAFVLLLGRRLGLSNVECGFDLPKRPMAIVIGIALGLVFAIIDSLANNEHSRSNIESILFQLTMPGLQEEALYRGLMLYLWDRCFGRPCRLLGVQVGAGCLITTVLFAVGHMVALDGKWQPMINLDVSGWLNLLVFSLAMCWLRYRFESVWPAVIAHNVDNGVVQIITH